MWWHNIAIFTLVISGNILRDNNNEVFIVSSSSSGSITSSSSSGSSSYGGISSRVAVGIVVIVAPEAVEVAVEVAEVIVLVVAVVVTKHYKATNRTDKFLHCIFHMHACFFVFLTFSLADLRIICRVYWTCILISLHAHFRVWSANKWFK